MASRQWKSRFQSAPWLGELEDQIPLASAYKDLPEGRKRAGWKTDFLRSVQKAGTDMADISEEEILRTVRQYRSGRKKPPEITVVVHSKKENGLSSTTHHVTLR